MQFNFNNKRLIKFADGQWGIRYGWIFYTFQDFIDPEYTWSAGSRYFKSCCRTSEEEARARFENPFYQIVE